MIFPTESGKNLQGTMYTLPEDFEYELNIVSVAFTQYQQYDVNTWITFLVELADRFESVGIYEVPVVKNYNVFQRMMLDYWMRTGIPDPAVQARTITLYTDVDAFVRALNLPGTDAIYTLLVDRLGRVHWWTPGRFDMKKGQSLVEAITHHYATSRADHPS